LVVGFSPKRLGILVHWVQAGLVGYESEFDPTEP
jgi:hypothetical protein